MRFQNIGNNYTFFGLSIGIYRGNAGVFIYFHILSPESQCIVYPAIGNSAMAQSVAMS